MSNAVTVPEQVTVVADWKTHPAPGVTPARSLTVNRVPLPTTVTLLLVVAAAVNSSVEPVICTVDAAATARDAGSKNRASVIANARVKARRDNRLHEIVVMGCLLVLEPRCNARRTPL